MMRRLSISLFAVLLFGSLCPLAAQTTEAFRRKLADPSAEGARVVVTEAGEAADAVARGARSGSRLRFRGYRVCIFFDNGQDARAGAVAARTLFLENYPGVKVYMVYENPYFKVTVGDCLTAEEAIILKGRISGTFPKAFIKSEELSAADLVP